MSLLYTVSQHVLHAFFWAFYNHSVYFPKNVAYPEGVLIAANHASFLDPPLIAASWRTPVHFLARKTLFDGPILKRVITKLNAHPLEKNNELQTFKLAVSLLQQGKNILIFPEGTRSENGKIASFKTGAALLAQKTKVPIIPTFIHGTFDAWPKTRTLFLPIGYETICLFGKPLYIEDFGEKKQAQQGITEALHSQVLDLQKHFENKDFSAFERFSFAQSS